VQAGHKGDETMAIIKSDSWKGKISQEIVGISQLTELFKIDSENNYNSDGRIYVDTFDIYLRVADGKFLLVESTGWDGHKECGDRLINTFASYEEAYDARKAILEEIGL
jgi:hypothetical protein